MTEDIFRHLICSLEFVSFIMKMFFLDFCNSFSCWLAEEKVFKLENFNIFFVSKKDIG